jgi:hypothetical protein
MPDKSKQFPQYRKLPNGKSFYKILDDRSFLELQKMGSRWWLYMVEAKQYPEVLKIMDMIAFHDPYILGDEIEFENIYSNVKKNVEN